MYEKEAVMNGEHITWLQDQEMHRWEVQQLISRAMGMCEASPNVAVVGAGNWEDLNWVELAAHAARVVCFDTGHTGSQLAAEGITAPIAQKIEVVSNADVAGLAGSKLLDKLQQLFDGKVSAADIISGLEKLMPVIEASNKLKELHGKFDLVISNATHTQLFYIDALLMLAPSIELFAEPEVEAITRQFRSVRERVVEAYNRELQSLVKPGGVLLIWTEVMKLDDRTKSILDELYMVRSEHERVRTMFQTFGSMGDEAAVTGLKLAFDQMSPATVHFNSWLWPISTIKQYWAAGLVGQLNQR
jgi:hypothetical protein